MRRKRGGARGRGDFTPGAITLPPTQVGLARLAQLLVRNPGKPGFRGGEGRPGARSAGGRGGGTTLAWSKLRPPPLAPPRHALRARWEGKENLSCACW